MMRDSSGDGPRIMFQKNTLIYSELKMTKINPNWWIRTRQIVSLVVVLLMVAAIAVIRNHRLFGHDFEARQETVNTNQPIANGMVISTDTLGGDIKGFAGPTPVQIYVNDGKVVKVVPLANQETPNFLKKVEGNGLFNSWDGLTVEEALNKEVDAVTGATFTSRAVIANVQRGLSKVADTQIVAPESKIIEWTPALIVGIVVVLCAAILPLFIHSRWYRLGQMCANFIVLGVWCGSFVSYTSMVDFVANGFDWGKILILIIIAVALLFPLFGRANHYCNWVCPLGSAQELAGKCVKYKIKVKARTMKIVGYVRQGLWALLMLCLWSGMWLTWMDNEIFTLFLWEDASVWVLCIAGLFLLLSFVFPRPFCQGICPVGTLLRTLPGK